MEDTKTKKLTIRSSQDVTSLGTILSVWAHPDDETFVCAGIMLAALANGQNVICVTATKGEEGLQDPSRWTLDTLGEVRAQELRAALDILGVQAHHWLGYVDGTCHTVSDQEAAAKIRAYIEQYQPDSILTFGPEGMTGHLDHQAISRWVDLAVGDKDIKVFHAVVDIDTYDSCLKEADKLFNIFYNIDKPPLCEGETCDICLRLTPEQLARKREALQAMPSQTAVMFEQAPEDMLDDMLKIECFMLKERS